MNKGESALVRSALGRIGFVGELYDARNESFSSKSLFKGKALSSLIAKTDVNRLEIDYRFTEDISERFNLLNIEGELQICLLCGLIDVKGCGKYLKEEKKSCKSISCSLMCKFETVSEKIFGSLRDHVNDMDLSVLKNDQYTHLIVETTWGANCILNLEATYESDSNRSEIEGNLKGEFNKIAGLLKVEGKCDVDYADNSSHLLNNIKVNVSADVIPEGELPISVKSFCSMVSNLPDLIKKSNDGRGKPLKYVMIPLSNLREMAEVKTAVEIVVKKIDEAFLISTICFFEEISALKLKISDLIEVLKKNEKYVSKNDISQARQKYASLTQQESSLKELLKQNWVAVRSGSKNLRDLVREVEKFKNHSLQLFHYEEYLESCSEVLKVIEEIKTYTSQGVTYLGRGESVGQEFINNVSMFFVVLVKSKMFEKENPDLHQSTCIYFMGLVQSKESSTKYVVVDLDYLDHKKQSTIFGNVTRTTCVRMKEGKVIVRDLFADYLCNLNSNFVKIKDGEEVENNRYKPGNRVFLSMACPGEKSHECSSKKQVWICFSCKENVEYDFAGYFYCGCGKAKATSYEYRCSDNKHGSSFVSAPANFLKNELSVLKPFQEVNILILGQTGVGKSTWINSIVNYMKYESLNAGRQGGVICTIPIKFTYYDSQGKEYDIRLGDPDDGEVLATGQSATQYCRTYCFVWKDRYFRLIDSPGIGDVRGIDKDKENMKHIIDYIGHLQELHGVCILFKANESKIGAIFSYCLKELLVHLHKDVAKNIVFCFTNARNSFYSPGQTSVLIRKLMSDLKIHDQLSLGPHNNFCLDNEAFLFLCMLQYPEIDFQHLLKDFEQSWNVSVKETYRLFETILKFQPHLLNQTVSLCTARNRIILLSKPLAEISKNIQINLRGIQQHKSEVETTQKTLEELQKQLYFDEYHLETTDLSQPRTVCTNAKCVERFQIKSLGITETEYKTHCHMNCHLRNVTPKTTNTHLLQRCKAMKNGFCTNCGCGWEAHMHLLVEQKRVVKTVKSAVIECDINKNLSAKETKEKIIQELEDRLNEYKKEQEIITKISVKMGMFLKKNAISVFNDAISCYLKYIIEEAENNPRKTHNDEILLKELKETLKKYEKEIEILQKVVEADDNSKDLITVEDVYRLEQELYSLRLTGKDIKKYVENQMSATSNQVKYSEVQLYVRVPRKTDTQKLQQGKTMKAIRRALKII